MWVQNLCEFFCWFQKFCLNFKGSCSSLGFAKTKKKHQSKKDQVLVAKNSDGRQEDPQILYMETLSPCVVPSRQWFGCQLLLPLNFTPIMQEFSSSEPHFLRRWPILRDPQQVTTIEKADISNKDTNGLCFKCSVKEICLSFGAFTLKELCFLFSVLLPSSSGSTHPQVTSSFIMSFEISASPQTS